MKGYMLGSITILVTYSVISSLVFAQSIDIGDCRKDLPLTIFVGNEYKSYTNIFPSELLIVAQRNLANYCYDQRREFTNREKIDIYVQNNRTKEYAESPRLVDHIIDVGMRYLDAREEYLYDGMVVDAQGSSRVNKVDAFGENIIGGAPLELQTNFTTHRGSANHMTPELMGQSCADSRARMTDLNTRRAKVSLSQKYITLCEWTSCLVNSHKKLEASDFLPQCLSLANVRIGQEQAYVQGLLSLQGTQAIKSSIEGYIHTSMTRTNFARLFDKIVKMVKNFAHINNKVPEITRMCSA